MRSILLLICLTAFVNCQSPKSSPQNLVEGDFATEVEEVNINYKGEKGYKEPDPFFFTQNQIADDLYQVDYRNLSKSYTWILSADTTKDLQYKVDDKVSSKEIYLIDNKFLFFDRQWFTVYKFAQNASVFDGCQSIFWAPEYGIIFRRNTASRHVSIFLPKESPEKIYQIAILILSFEDFGTDCLKRENEDFLIPEP